MARGNRAGRRAERARRSLDSDNEATEDLAGLALMPHSWPGRGLPPDERAHAEWRGSLSASPPPAHDAELEPDELEPSSLPLPVFPSTPRRRPPPTAPSVPDSPRAFVPELPCECIALIVAHLDVAADLVAVQRLGRVWQRCASDEEPWRRLCVSAWPVCVYDSLPHSSALHQPAAKPTPWRERYVAMLTQRALTWGETAQGARAHPAVLALPMPFGCFGEVAARALAKRSIREVSFGRRHAAMLTFAGQVWTVGAGVDGALGHGDTLPMRVPRRVEVLASRELCAVSCGVAHTAVLTVEHEAVLWGLNSSGQLGTGDTVRCAVPHAAPAVCQLPPIGAIACGGTHTLLGALFGAQVWVLGDDHMSTGHVATPHPPGVELVPRPVLPPSARAPDDALGAEADGAGGAPARCIVASDGFSAVVDAAGTLWTWGAESAAGRLGRPVDAPDAPGAHEPAPVGALHGRAVVSVSASSGHVSAACEDGSVWAWGKGTLGQLGNGSRTSCATPRPISVFGGTGARAVVQVACGEAFSLARTRKGEVFCWGQLGGAGNGSRTVPRPVKALGARSMAVVRLAAGGNVAAALVRWAPSHGGPPSASPSPSPSPSPQLPVYARSAHNGNTPCRASGGDVADAATARGGAACAGPRSAPSGWAAGGGRGDERAPVRADGGPRARAHGASGGGVAVPAAHAVGPPVVVRGFAVERGAEAGMAGWAGAGAEQGGASAQLATPGGATPGISTVTPGAAPASTGASCEFERLARELQARATTEWLLGRFVADGGVQHLVFPPSLSPRERHAVRYVAEGAGLAHASMGAGTERRLLVSKMGATPPPLATSLGARFGAGDEAEPTVAWLPADVLSGAHAPTMAAERPGPAAGRRRRSQGRRVGASSQGGFADAFGPSSL